MDPFDRLQTVFYGASLLDWSVALGIAALVFLLVALLKPILLRRLGGVAQRTHTGVDDAILEMVKSTAMPLVAVIAFFVGTQYLSLTGKPSRVIDRMATLALFVQAGLWGTGLLRFWLDRARRRALEHDAATATSLAALGFISRMLLWILVGLLALDNLGVNVTTLIAGLGVGGIAVALAVQNILGDLLASLSIVMDKPFVIGDFIIVDNYMGTVEYVGLKTTRIRSLDGEQIIFSNGDLLKTRVRNYKRMYERRCVFKFGVVYKTPPEKLEEIPPLVKRLVEQHEKVRFERSHFARLGESSLDFETIYWVTNPDYTLFMNIQQAINLALMREFAQRGVEFAYPTRTLEIESLPTTRA
jgi:small-conductance mechanosensitive channel